MVAKAWGILLPWVVVGKVQQPSAECLAAMGNEVCSGQFGSRNCVTCQDKFDEQITKKKAPPDIAYERISINYKESCGACNPDPDSVVFSDDALFQLVWQDEFDSGAGITPIDDTKWKFENSGGFHNNGWGNEELQFYTPRLKNVWMSDNTLKIRAIRERRYGEGNYADMYKEYTSAKISSKVAWKYCKVMMRTRVLGDARGTWAAHWMMPQKSDGFPHGKYGEWPRSGEIDILEHVGYDSNATYGTVHTAAYHHTIGTEIGGVFYTDVTAWHEWTIEWKEDVILFGVDGYVYQVFRKEEKPTKWTATEVWPFDQPFYVILNMAVGGHWGGSEGIDMKEFWGMGQVMETDWVRIFQKIENLAIANHLTVLLALGLFFLSVVDV